MAEQAAVKSEPAKRKKVTIPQLFEKKKRGGPIVQLAVYEKHVPRHSKIYFDMVPVLDKVYRDYIADVKGRAYPGPEHTVFMKEEELKRFKEMVGWKA